MDAKLDTKLESKVSKMEAKAERIETEKHRDSKLDSSKRSINRLTKTLGSIEETAEELAFYVGILEKVFDGKRPDVVVEKIDAARETAAVDDETILEAAEKNRFAELVESVGEAEDDLDHAMEEVTDLIEEDYQSPWQDDLDSAKQLNQIIGGGDNEFLDIISNIKTFLEYDIWDSSNSVQGLAAQWERLQDTWERNSGKHGWEQFQQQHGLSEETIEEIRQFTTKDTVRLSDLSITTLEEVKSVSELETALQVELRST